MQDTKPKTLLKNLGFGVAKIVLSADSYPNKQLVIMEPAYCADGESAPATSIELTGGSIDRLRELLIEAEVAYTGLQKKPVGETPNL